MRISVLLPTRDRLSLLRLAVDSVLAQDDPDIEIVIADNASSDDTEAWARSLDDPRIRVVRSDVPIHVTDNWNAAVAAASGDYLIMLGDDDALLRRYCAVVREAIVRHHAPDLVYTSALQVVYPGATPDAPRGSVAEHCPGSITDAAAVHVLDRARARDLVRSSAAFRMRFGFNMQYALFSRELMDRTCAEGRLFHSEYPDYYAMNALFLRASRIVVIPAPAVAIGISPKSFGHFLFSDRSAEGYDMLFPAPARSSDGRSPVGSRNLANWYDAMRELRRLQPGAPPVRLSRYLALQFAYVLRNGYIERSMSRAERDRFWEAVPPAVRLPLRGFAATVGAALRLVPRRLIRRIVPAVRGVYVRVVVRPPATDRAEPRYPFATIADVVAAEDPLAGVRWNP